MKVYLLSWETANKLMYVIYFLGTCDFKKAAFCKAFSVNKLLLSTTGSYYLVHYRSLEGMDIILTLAL